MNPPRQNTYIQMNRKTLETRIGIRDILTICSKCSGSEGNAHKQTLFSLITDPDQRTAYNALWVFTHFSSEDTKWLYNRRNRLIDILLKESHTGNRRLLLTLLDKIPCSPDDLRSDYLDFCLANINSIEPYAIRALSIKQAFSQCRFHEELLHELTIRLDMLDREDLSPALRSTRRNVTKQINQIRNAASRKK